jgi:hypothetical protein
MRQTHAQSIRDQSFRDVRDLASKVLQERNDIVDAFTAELKARRVARRRHEKLITGRMPSNCASAK